MQGLDVLVFTAGIGENQPEIRARVAAQLGWLGLDLDPAANAVNARQSSTPESSITALVIPTNKEFIIAAEAASLKEIG